MSKKPLETLSETFEMCVEMRKMNMEVYNEFFKTLSFINELPIASQKQIIWSIYEYLYDSNKDISKIFIQMHRDLTNKTLEVLDKYTNHPKEILTQKMLDKLKCILAANEQKLLSFEKQNTKHVFYIIELEKLIVSKIVFLEKDWKTILDIIIDMNNDLLQLYEDTFNFLTQCMCDINDSDIHLYAIEPPPKKNQ